MASFRKTKSGKWKVEIYIGENPSTGKPKKVTKIQTKKRCPKMSC